MTSFSVSGVVGGREGLWAGNFLFALLPFFFTGSPTRRIALQTQSDTCFALFKIKGMKLKRA